MLVVVVSRNTPSLNARRVALPCLGVSILMILAAIAVVAPASATASPGADTSVEKYRSADSAGQKTPATAPQPTYVWTEIGGSTHVPGTCPIGVGGTCTAPAAGTGTSKLDDGEWNSGACLALGFTFNFYGTSRDCVYVHSHGLLFPWSTTAAAPALPANPQYAGQPEQMPSATNPVIAARWQNMAGEFCTSGANGGIWYKQISNPKSFVVEFSGILVDEDHQSTSTCGGAGGGSITVDPQSAWNTFEVIIYPSDATGVQADAVEVMFNSVKTIGVADCSALMWCDTSTGIDKSNTQGLSYQYSTGGVAYASRAVRFYPNHKPVADTQTLTGNEDGTATLTLTAVDDDKDAITCALGTAPTGLSLSGCTVSYTPSADVCNDTYPGAGSMSFKWTPTDALGLAGVEATVDIKIKCVNDKPSFSLPVAPDVSANDGAGPFSKPNYATSLNPGNTMGDEQAQSMKFVLTTDKDTAFVTLPTISPSSMAPKATWPTSGVLKFEPKPGSCTMTPVTVTAKLVDNGGTLNSGVDTSDTATFKIDILCGGTAPPTSSTQTTPQPAAQPSFDTDSDGTNDDTERQYGSDPNNGLSTPSDVDGDGIENTFDNCRNVANGDQVDANGDGIGDACQNGGLTGTDTDGDGITNSGDNCPTIPNPKVEQTQPDGKKIPVQPDMDHDFRGDVCDDDIDGDGFSNAKEADLHSDPQNVKSVPDDRDGDGVTDDIDNCAPSAAASSTGDLKGTYNPNQDDTNHNNLGDACERRVALDLKDATARYDGRSVLVQWTVVGDAHIRSQAEILDGDTVLAHQSIPAFGPGPKSQVFDLPNLAKLQWRVVLDDPYNATQHKEATGTLTAPAPEAPLPAKVVTQPSNVTAGQRLQVAYQLPQTATAAHLELQNAAGRTMGTVELSKTGKGVWGGVAPMPAAGSYKAVVVYTQQGSRQVFDAGNVVSSPTAASPANADATGATNSAATPTSYARLVFTSLAVLGGLALIGLVAIAVVAMQRRRAAAAAAADAAEQAAPDAPAPDAAESADYDSPIDV